MGAKKFLAEFDDDMKKMKAQAGYISAGFGALFVKTMGEGALTVKQKELIALAIAVADHCEPCLLSHTRKCLDVGASKEEILEACGVAVVMGGGPAYTHVALVVNAMEELTS